MPSTPSCTDHSRIGPYELLEEIGGGGMGTVWRARRADGLMEREVAIKLIAMGMRTMAMRERFARERQILAALNHPNIARLYEAGVTDSGQPYLVLELVEGQPIDVYCNERRLDVAARVRLFMQVLAAVQHAHQHLVVHRDLKPGNILVTPEGTVKLLDFGISKLLQDHAAAEEAGVVNVTREVGRILTPEFAAPEQLSGESVTTAADVYSAGVLLYQLVSGAKPYLVTDTRPATLVRAILEREPLSASATARVVTRARTRFFIPTAQTRAANDDCAVDTNGAESPIETRAQQRGTTPARLRQALVGDLDNILAKALKKDPYERYETAAEFAEDLRAHLEFRPVRAQPDSMRYRASKFMRRNRGTVATAGITLLAILAGIGATTWQTFEARKQAEIARSETAKANAIRDYVVNMFRAVGRDAKEFPKRGETTARELLDSASTRLQTEFGEQPDVKMFLRSTFTDLYFGIDHTPKALNEAQRWLADAERSYGAKSPQTIDAMIQVGTVLGRMNRAAEANEILAAAVARLDDAPRGEQWVRAQLVRTLLSSSEYKTADAAGLVAEVKPYVSQFPHLQADLDYAEGQLAFQTGKFRMGAQKLQAAIAHFSKVHGEDSSRVAEAKWRIGILHLYRNDWQEAERELTQALRMLKARSAPGHRDLLVVQRDLAFAKMRSGHREEAYALIDEIVGNARKRAELDSNKAFLAGALQTWGRIRLSAGDMAAAERAFNEAVALVSNGNERNVFPAMIRFDVSQVLHARGDKAAASSMAKEVIEIYTEPKAGYSPTNVAVAYISLAAVVKDTDPALAKEWLAKGRAHDWSETAFPSTLSRAYLIAAEIAAAEQNREGVLKELTAARALLSKHASNPEAAFRHAQVDLLTIRLLGAGAPQSEAPCAGIETVREVVARFTVESSTAHRHANEAKQLCTAEHGRRT